ncbi:MAG: HAMP domain-containing histidine kinase [Firmicutes bacterium]|nr:HAMP domain-containing histidine kinase [Bacillota bacterium]
MRLTIVATYIAVIIITLILMTVYTLGVLGDNLYENEYVDMFTKANIISVNVSQDWDSNPDEAADKFRASVENSLAGTNIRGIVTDTSYTILYDTNTDAELIGKVFMRDVIKYALNGEQAQTMDKNGGDTKMISVSVPVEVNSSIVGSVYLNQNIKTIDNTVAATRTSLIVFSVLIILLVGMLSVGMSYIITSPVEQFTKAAREISKGNFSIRMNVKGHNELTEMGETFNYMCDELELLEERRRKFVSDASHELKTPMAGIKLICDSLLAAKNVDMDTVRDFLKDMSYEIERLTRIIDRLLVLTHLNAGDDAMKQEETDIRGLVENIIKNITPIAKEKDILIYSKYDPNITKPMFLDYDKIYEALFNIVDNAVKYTPESGRVHIEVADAGETVKIFIEDNGLGIPDEEKDRIFERFYRVDDSRARDTGGTGLGLAISKEAVVMHGGTVKVEDSSSGGSIFVVELPYNGAVNNNEGDTV